jgi:putative phosphoesterase
MRGGAIIGLISDTHGLLRPEALTALEGSDLVIHAGDVGQAGIIEQLRAVAPVVAVRGNVDKGPWASELPLTAVAEVGSALLYVLHDIQQLDLDPAAATFSFVVSGHSHKPGHTERSGVVYVNPGSAGPRRFQLPITVARLDLRQVPWRVEFIDLAGGKTRLMSHATPRVMGS